MCRRLLTAIVVLAGCGSTVDFFGSQTTGTGSGSAGSVGSTSDAVASTSTTGLDDESDGGSAGVTGTGDTGPVDSSGDSGDTGPSPTLCERLDVLFVLDNSVENTGLLDLVSANAVAIGVVLTDPTQPWAEDFHVGVVPTLDTDGVGTCRVAGGLSLQPNAVDAPCQTAGGQPWATQDDDLVDTVQCLADLEIAAPAPRAVALAAARGLSVPPATDPMGAAVVAGCNEGFAREQSLKLVIVATADDDEGSPGDGVTWVGWFSGLHDAPAGTELALAGIIPEGPAMDPCPGPATELSTWISAEPNAYTSDWCAFSGMGTLQFVVDLEQLLGSLC